MNWKPTHDPNRAIAPRLARTRGAERRMPRRTSGKAERRSTAVNTANSAAAPANETSVRADAQPTSGASTTV